VILLGIETSCDETAAAVVEEGTRVLSSVVSSQVAVHRPFGGVVPEVASRKHMEAVVPVVSEALAGAGIPLSRLEAVAVTQGPGLVGSLLVGFNFAKACALALGIPFVGIDHLAGHLHSALLGPEPPAFPFVALLVSGGHTALFHVKSPAEAVWLGQSRDDAAGEAFDKVAKALGLGYPGGVLIEALAEKGNPEAVRFPRPLLSPADFEFSFSGLKTAVIRHIRSHPETLEKDLPDIAAGFQEAAVDVLSAKLLKAADILGIPRVAVVGGVAANRRLRERISREARDRGYSVHIPAPGLCGDNAVMVAAAGHHALRGGRRGTMEDDVYSRTPSPAGATLRT